MKQMQMSRTGLLLATAAACLLAAMMFAVGFSTGSAYAAEADTDAAAGAGTADMALSTAAADLQTQAVTKYPVWVGNKRVTSKNAKNVLGDKKKSVVYKASTNTLTLKNAKIKKALVVKEGIHTFRYGIRNNQAMGLTIVLKGKNTIKVPGKARDASYGISSYYGGENRNVLIKGSGSLKVKASKSGGISWGITCCNLNIVGSAKVSAYGGASSKNIVQYGSYGVHATGFLALGGSAKLVASGKYRALNTAATFDQNYTPQVKAGASAKKIKVSKKNPASSVYTSYKYVSIAKAKAASKKPAKVKITKVAPFGGGFNISWKKVAKNCTGYQLQLKRNSTGKTWTFSQSGNAVGASLSSLAGGEKYTVRVRALNKVGSKTYYGAWSAKKTVTPYAGTPAG